MDNLTEVETQYFNMTEDDIDSLLFGINIDNNDTDKNKCLNCQSDNMVKDEENGYNVCSNCGVINKEQLDNTPNYENDKSSASYGSITNYYFPKSGLGTKIKMKGYNKMGILQNQGQMPYKEKSLMDEMKRIEERCKKHNITQNIIDRAKSLLKKVSDSKHTSGSRKGKVRIMRCINRKSMIAACLLYACKLEGEPRTSKEIANIYDLETKYVNRGYRKFREIVDISSLTANISSSKSFDYIKRFAKNFNIEQKYIDIAIDISNNIHKLEIVSTHEPQSVSAGCILLVSNIYKLKINRKKIAEVFDISDVTISKTYRRINQFQKIICNNKITDLILKEKNKKQEKLQISSKITKANLVVA